MKGYVLFRSGSARYAVRVSETRRVVPAAGLEPLPAPRPGVAGLLRGEGEPLPVLEGLHPDTGQVLELDAGGRRFGLLVGEVTGVLRESAGELGPPPGGQQDAVIAGTVHDRPDGAPALLLDATVLGRRLGS